MKKKLAKQKRKLFAIIAVALFMLSVAMCSIFVPLMYINNLEVLYNRTAVRFNVLLRPTLTYMNIREVADYSINLNHYVENNVEVIVKYQDSEEIYTQTRNCQPMIIELEDIGSIEYDSLYASMTDEQYNKISDYLLTEFKEDEEEYCLYFSEYYYQGIEIKPTKVGIFKNKYDGINIIESVPIESFVLSPSHDETAVLRTTYDNNRIDTEFFLGRYKNDDLMSEIQGIEPTQISEYSDDPPVYFTGLFEFVLCHTEDVKIWTDDGDFTVTATYLEKVNTIEGCIGEIAMVCGFTLYIFAIAGVIIGIVLWNTMKKQIEQEERLRTATNAMAHELKTPLFIIGGYAENLAENVNTEKRTHYAQVITEQTNSMNEMVSKMLDYSKLDSENFTLNIERFEISELVKEICDNYKLNNSQIECENGIFIEADKKLIKSVVENLIDNAVKYTTDIGKISVKLKNGEFSVQNPYKAVTKQEIEDMWKPYYRSTEQNKAKGHGLGLAIVKNILDLHGYKYGAKYSDDNIIFSFEFK